MIPIYQENLLMKQRQIEQMKEEVRGHEELMGQLTIETERLKKELQNFKKKYLIQKKKEQQDRDQKKRDEEYIKVVLPDKRFTGGGFNLAI